MSHTETISHPAALAELSEGHVPLDHPRLWRVEPAIFVTRFHPDCMKHRCRCLDEGGIHRTDACCQHGADVSLFERDAILAREKEVASVMSAAFRSKELWFDESAPETDEEFPSGTIIRSGRTGDPDDDAGGCVFLAHDRRGCALHRAALIHHFDPAEIKPMVCRLYPLAYGEHALSLSDDFARYSCANAMSGPTVYRLMRTVVAEIFGLGAARVLDQAEAGILRTRIPARVCTSPA